MPFLFVPRPGALLHPGRAAFLCADLELTLEPREDHAAYIANWLDVLKADNCAIFAAASYAQRAADFIDRMQPASEANS